MCIGPCLIMFQYFHGKLTCIVGGINYSRTKPIAIGYISIHRPPDVVFVDEFGYKSR